MNKVTTAALAGLMVVAVGAQASVSRWNGFGSAQAYIADVQDIFTLPGVVASHPDTTYIELGTARNNPSLNVDEWGTGEANDYGIMNTVDQSAYNHINDARMSWGGVNAKALGGVIGVWYNRPNNALNGITGPTLGFFTVPDGGFFGGAARNNFYNLINGPLNNQFDVLYGYTLSDATTLGFGISRATNDSKSETVNTATTSTDDSLDDFGISLGVEQKEVGPIALLEVGLQYNSRSAAHIVKGVNTDKLTAAGSGINIRVGGDLAGKDGMFGRVELGLNMQNLGIKAEPSTSPASTDFTESKNSAMGWNLGYAMGGTKDKGMGLCGLMLIGTSSSLNEANNTTEVNKFDTSKLHLLATTAGEAKLNSLLTFRAGLESDLFYSNTTVRETGASGATTKTTNTQSAHAGSFTDPNATASMGLSLTLGDITIDGVLNQDLLYTGTYLISGTPGAVSSQVSLTWPWGGSKN